MANEDKIQELLIGQAKMFTQLERIISDIESEKEVRKRITEDLILRIRVLEDSKNIQDGKNKITDRIVTIICTVVAGILIWLLTKK